MDNNPKQDDPDYTYTRVEVERMEGTPPSGYTQPPPQQFIMPRPPIISTWIMLIASWMFLGSAIPFTVVIGLPLNLVTLLLAIVCLSRGGLKTGVVVMLLGTVGSFIVYLKGLFMFLGAGA